MIFEQKSQLKNSFQHKILSLHRKREQIFDWNEEEKWKKKNRRKNYCLRFLHFLSIFFLICLFPSYIIIPLFFSSFSSSSMLLFFWVCFFSWEKNFFLFSFLLACCKSLNLSLKPKKKKPERNGKIKCYRLYVVHNCCCWNLCKFHFHNPFEAIRKCSWLTSSPRAAVWTHIESNSCEKWDQTEMKNNLQAAFMGGNLTRHFNRMRIGTAYSLDFNSSKYVENHKYLYVIYSDWKNKRQTKRKKKPKKKGKKSN